MHKPTLASLCCGAGLADLGFAGEPVWAIDSDPLACRAYQMNHGLVPICDSIDAPWLHDQDSVLPVVDVVLTGPPCQDDSKMGPSGQGGARSRLKISALALARRLVRPGGMVVMEMVGYRWTEWAQGEGAAVTVLRDSDLGGYTSRERVFAVWGATPAPLMPIRPVSPGWGAVLPHRPGDVLAYEGNSVNRRWSPALVRRPDQPAHTVMAGHGTHRIGTSQKDSRHGTPREMAVLQGHPGLILPDATVHDLQRLVGNGWPASFGRYWRARWDQQAGIRMAG